MQERLRAFFLHPLTTLQESTWEEFKQEPRALLPGVHFENLPVRLREHVANDRSFDVG